MVSLLSPKLLVVEDNSDDVFILRRSISRMGMEVELIHACNGRECMDLLYGKTGALPLIPDLILLDINMPIMDGREVLSEMARDEKLCQIPVVMLTTSESEQEIADMHRLQCNSYITKPVDFEEFHAMIEALCNYWFSTVRLPRRNAVLQSMSNP